MATAGEGGARRCRHQGTRDEMDAARWPHGRAHRAPRPHAGRDADPAAPAPGGILVSRSASTFSREELLEVLDGVMDPEVPVLSVVELGIVRDMDIRDDGVIVTVTPTYS